MLCLIFLSDRQAPILPVLAVDRGRHIAPHCYYNVYGRKFVQQFAILRLLHVNAIELFYQPNCVLVDLRHSLRASGVTSNTSEARYFPSASVIWLRQELWTQINATLGF